ncbi:MAG: hypothetical protein H7Z40_11210, partial [Phycisphaerae bacterium]|nr:hypothetical protein [Gemmatimonadaceae bacterium]
MTLCLAQDHAGAEDTRLLLSQQIVVAAPDALAAKAMERALTSQRWPNVRVVHPVANAVSDALACGAHALFIAAGTTLKPNALENAWWALETRPEVGFIAFGDERGAATPMLETLASCVLVRAAMLSTHAATSDARWPGFAPVFAVLERGTRGHLLREPLLSYGTKPSSAPMAGAIVELRAKGLTDAVLGDLGGDPAPSPEPLYSLDEQPLPDVVPVRASKRPANGQHRLLV